MTLTLYHAPRTRAFTALWLLEELGQPFEVHSFDMASGYHRSPEYLALNPMGKVPMLMDGDTPVSEMGAIALYLLERFPGSGLAPAVGDPKRAEFLRWMFFVPGIVEPALAQKFFGWQPPRASVAWGSYDLMIEVAEKGLESGPWLLGDTFSAADVVVGAALRFGVLFGAIDSPAIKAYVERATARPAFERAMAREASLAEAAALNDASQEADPESGTKGDS